MVYSVDPVGYLIGQAVCSVDRAGFAQNWVSYRWWVEGYEWVWACESGLLKGSVFASSPVRAAYERPAGH